MAPSSAEATAKPEIARLPLAVDRSGHQGVHADDPPAHTQPSGSAHPARCPWLGVRKSERGFAMASATFPVTKTSGDLCRLVRPSLRSPYPAPHGPSALGRHQRLGPRLHLGSQRIRIPVLGLMRFETKRRH